MSTTATHHRPVHLPTTWLLALIAVLAAIAIELGVAGVWHTTPQVTPVPTQSVPLPPTMSGDLLRFISA